MGNGASVGDVIAGIISGGASIGFGIYDRYKQNQMYQEQNELQKFYNDRDFDYQKALQNQIFEREDNAIQRRMADLKAAGLNPVLAASGSGAGAGSVVGRSSTTAPLQGYQGIGNPVGTAFDYISHVQQLRQQKMQNENLKMQNEILGSYGGTEKLAQLLDRAQMYKQLGINDLQLRYINGQLGLWSKDFNNMYNGKHFEINDSPLLNTLQLQYQNNQNSAAMLQKDLDWYTADKIANMFGSAARATAGFGSAYSSFSKGNFYRR